MSGSSLSFYLGLPFLGLYVIFLLLFSLGLVGSGLYRLLVNKTSVDKKKSMENLYLYIYTRWHLVNMNETRGHIYWLQKNERAA